MLSKKLVTLVLFFHITFFFCLQTSHALPSSALANLLEKILGSVPSVGQSETKDKTDCYGRQIDKEEECPKKETPRPASPQKPKNFSGLDLGGLFGGLGGLGGGNSSSNNPNTNTGLTPFQSTSFAPTVAPAPVPAAVMVSEQKDDTKTQPKPESIPKSTKEKVAGYAQGENATESLTPLPPLKLLDLGQPKTAEPKKEVEVQKLKEPEPKATAAIITPPTKPEVPKAEENKVVFVKKCDTQRVTSNDTVQSALLKENFYGFARPKYVRSTNYSRECISTQRVNLLNFGKSFTIIYATSQGELIPKGGCSVIQPPQKNFVEIKDINFYDDSKCSELSTVNDNIKQKLQSQKIYAVRKGVNVELNNQ